MLIPIKTFYIKGTPSYDEIVEARGIAQQEDCVVELRWQPHILYGWCHEYIFSDSAPAEIYEKLPKVYGL